MNLQIMKRRLAGLTLLEIQVSLLLSTLMLLSLFKLYQAMVKSADLEFALQTIALNANRVLTLFEAEFSQAGYVGCRVLGKNMQIEHALPSLLPPTLKLNGSADSISVQYLAAKNYPLQMMSEQAMVVAKQFWTKPGDVLLLADCQHAEAVVVKDSFQLHHDRYLVPLTLLQHQYPATAVLGRLVNNTFYIAKTKRVYQNRKPIYGLFLRDVTGRVVEVAEGVQNLRIQYISKDNTGVHLLQANAITQWEEVVGVVVEIELTHPPLHKTWKRVFVLAQQ